MKPKYKFAYLILPLVAMMLTGCTRNNGDIGKWFGKWQLTEMTVDGEADPLVAGGQYFWDFQNDIIRIDCVAPNGYEHEVYYCIGTWDQPADNVMVMNFSHTDDGGIFHKPFGILHFPTDGPFTMTIVSQSGKECVMKRVDETSGTEYVYRLRKR